MDGESDPEIETARLRSRLGEHYSFERTRPDGTVMEIRNNPMPDGGVVVIYSDIAERKRSEEEIRAARDAADGAGATRQRFRADADCDRLGHMPGMDRLQTAWRALSFR